VGKLNGPEGARQKKEILDALKKLGEPLTGEEEIYLKQYTEGGNSNFAKMNESSGIIVNLLYSTFIFLFKMSMSMLYQPLQQNKLKMLEHLAKHTDYLSSSEFLCYRNPI
jgi:hypothetical protein